MIEFLPSSFRLPRIQGVLVKKILIWLGCSFFVATLAPIVRAGPEESVVKVFASIRFPDPRQPWAKGNPTQNSASGVIIKGNRILTNAHVVEYGTEVFVEARPGGEKVEASIEALNYDLDLAVLTVKDEKFFEKRPPMPRLDKLPKTQDPVSVYGFPIGGNDLSITKGEVSRIDFFNYGSRGVGLCIQVSASINPGNSGGPALVGDNMIGLVVSRVQDAQIGGYLIPNEEIDIFLNDLKDGHFEGKPMIAPGLLLQTLENQALRRKVKVEPSIRGLLVQSAQIDARPPLKPFDVIRSIGTYPLDNTGKVQLENGMQAPWPYLVPRLARDQSIPVTVWRQGKEFKAELPVTTKDQRLVRPYEGEPLPYFIHGPLVFAVAKSDDISLYAEMNRTLYLDNGPLVIRREDYVRFPGEELVVVSAPMFAHPIARGYKDPVGKTVKDINGTPIKNLRHLIETIRDSTDEFLTFRFADNWSETMVFDRVEMAKGTEEIMEDHGISPTRRGSPEMLKFWKGSAGK